MAILQVGTLVRGCRCATSLCDLDLTFDFAVLTLTYQILSGLYLRERKVYEVDTWYGHCIAISACMGNMKKIQTIIQPCKHV